MYFQNLPKFEYDTVELVDIFRRIAFTEETLNSLDSFVDYVVPDGFTPDRCAREFYGDANWFWVVLLSNNILSVESEWPKSQNKIQRRFRDTGFLNGSSLFFDLTRAFEIRSAVSGQKPLIGLTSTKMGLLCSKPI